MSDAAYCTLHPRILFLPCLCLNALVVAIVFGLKPLSGTNWPICRMWFCVPPLLPWNLLTRRPCGPVKWSCSEYCASSRKDGMSSLHLLLAPSCMCPTCSSRVSMVRVSIDIQLEAIHMDGIFACAVAG